MGSCKDVGTGKAGAAVAALIILPKKNLFFRLRLKGNLITAFYVHWSGDDNGGVRLIELLSVNSIVYTSKSGVYTCSDVS